MRWGRLAAPNYRGLELPRVLGLVLASCGVLSVLAYEAARDVEAAGWAALAGSLLVFAAGLIDDLVPVGPRGLRNHLRSLASGHMTTGILKLVVAMGAALVVVALQPPRPAGVEATGAVLLAACTNLWNGLDVVPGRALKAFLPVAVVALALGEPQLDPIVPGLALGAAVALPLDLRERAMLGDGGSNLLGFVAGLGLYGVLPGWGVASAALVAVALNVVADTLTLSRLIDAAPPLRWLDRLGGLRSD